MSKNTCLRVLLTTRPHCVFRCGNFTDLLLISEVSVGVSLCHPNSVIHVAWAVDNHDKIYNIVYLAKTAVFVLRDRNDHSQSVEQYS